MYKQNKYVENYSKITRALIQSPSWRLMSINCKRLIDFLLAEHLSKAGKENGNLYAPYDQLCEFGIARTLIHRTISEAEFYGLILVERGGRKGCVNHISKFTLTFVPRFNGKIFLNPTNQWRKVKEDEIRDYQSNNKIKGTSRTRTITVALSVNDNPIADN